MPLVEYDSSSASESEHEDQQSKKNGIIEDSKVKRLAKEVASTRPSKRLKKLPSLPDAFETAPKDDRSLHQGRRRTRPYVDGDYNAHVYLSLKSSSGFRAVLEGILRSIQDELPNHTIHSLLSSLHISLTHPLPLRRDQILPFRNSLAGRLKTVHKFKLSFASEMKIYYNRLSGGEEGNGGRAFVALRVGAGANEIEGILDKAIHPLLDIHHLPKYHEDPEFHTSFGWTLLNQKEDEADGEVKGEDTPGLLSDRITKIQNTSDSSSVSNFQHTPFSSDLIDPINTKYQDAILQKQPKGGWEVDNVYLKVSKEVHVLGLGPNKML
ncbi:hypothetical protein I203_101240 [Kwoniella mangroviensis CBS 8507]|uniref:uncharacterized protein n=1 Tax=Kwoniella mangroviensis CBS 8507 TaxID=1296122 RepID=UPI00080CE3B3|nr:uncharacterized protein I203_02876 [Kwoniella mangroviensis CBS 8507]OCF68213.1 hypothetical protein I203_02876 [Kwoniella mangroviensis CBS 8507]